MRVPTGETPIGAIVFDDERDIGIRTHTSWHFVDGWWCRSSGLLQADEALGFVCATDELMMAVSAEPCLKCMAAIMLGVSCCGLL